MDGEAALSQRTPAPVWLFQSKMSLQLWEKLPATSSTRSRDGPLLPASHGDEDGDTDERDGEKDQHRSGWLAYRAKQTVISCYRGVVTNEDAIQVTTG